MTWSFQQNWFLKEINATSFAMEIFCHHQIFVWFQFRNRCELQNRCILKAIHLHTNQNMDIIGWFSLKTQLKCPRISSGCLEIRNIHWHFWTETIYRAIVSKSCLLRAFFWSWDGFILAADLWKLIHGHAWMIQAEMLNETEQICGTWRHLLN